MKHTEELLVKFSENESLYYKGCTEKWYVDMSEPLDYGYGYTMYCEVYQDHTLQFTDRGETFEIAFYAYRNRDDYPILNDKLNKVLKTYGKSRNINMNKIKNFVF